MKKSFFFIIFSTSFLLFNTSYLHATLAKEIRVQDFQTAVQEEATNVLTANGISLKNLPQKHINDFQTTVTFITKKLTDWATRQKKSSMTRDIFYRYFQPLMNELLINLLNVANEVNLKQVISNKVESLALEKEVRLEKLPVKMKRDLEDKKQTIFDTLVQFMKNEQRDYVTLDEVDAACRKKLNIFFEHAKYVILSLTVQPALATLNSLKDLTNTSKITLVKEPKKTTT